MGATNTLNSCINTQDDIVKIFGASNPLTKSLKTLGTTAALKSAANVGGFEIEQAVRSPKAKPDSSSNRKVTVRGRAKGCPSVATSATSVCTAVTAETSDYIDQEVQVTQYRESKFSLSYATYKDVCEGKDSVMAYKTVEAMESVLKARNTYMIEQLLSDADSYQNGDSAAAGSADEQLVKLFSASAVPQPVALFRIIEEYRRKGYAGISPIMIGGTQLSAWLFQIGYYQGINDAGLDFSRIPDNIPSFVDYELDTVAQGASYANGDGASRLFTFIPGMAQIVEWFDFEAGSPTAITRPDLTKTTMEWNGEIFDYQVKEDDCGTGVTVIVSKNFDLFVPSTDFFASNCGGEETLLSWTVDPTNADGTDVTLA